MNRVSLQVTPLTSSNEDIFLLHIQDKFEEYFFFHVDYMQYPEDTEIFLALNNDKKIHGMLLIWKGRRMQIRGSIEAVDLLLKTIKRDPISVTGFEEHKKIIALYFPNHLSEKAIYRMSLKKGNQNYFEKYSFVSLSEENRNEIITLMKIADPVYWSSPNPEDLLIDNNNLWYGVKKQDTLTCIVGVWFYDKIGYIIIVGTHPDYWNEGMASSLISSTLKDIFKEREYCYIQVRVKNPPAIHLYSKLGFRICNTQFSYER